MWKKVLLTSLVMLTGCLTLHGSYRITVEDKDGKPVNTKLDLYAEGSGIYTVRNSMCSVYPGAVIRIRDSNTNQELKSESPYHCR